MKALPQSGLLLVSTLGIGVLTAACGNDATDPRAELLALQDTVRRAHLDYDADLFVSLFADTVTITESGETTTLARERAHRRFQAYFDRVTFLSWSDLEPPSVALSASEDLAAVRVRRRVRLGVRDTLERARPESSVFAWTEIWRRRSDRWRLGSVTSTRRPAVSDLARPEREARPEWHAPGDGPSSDRILERARARVEIETRLDTVETLAYTADGASPDGGFTTSLWSDRRGRSRLVQLTSANDTIRVRVGPRSGSSSTAAGPEPDDARDPRRAFLQGHSLLQMAVDPIALLGRPQRVGRVAFTGVSADLVEFRDAAGRPLDLVYERRTGRLLGARVRTPPPSSEVIVVYLSGWKVSNGLLLPGRAVFAQGSDLYLYDFTDVRVNSAHPDDP